MRIITISPLYIPLELKSGIDPRLKLYESVIAALPARSEEFFAPNRDETSDRADFGDLSQDDYDLRLLVWTPAVEEDEPRAEFHIYSNGICSVMLDFILDDTHSAADTEGLVQRITCEQVDRYAPRMNQLLADICARLPKYVIDQDQTMQDVSSADIAWTARMAVIEEPWLTTPTGQAFVTNWLSETLRPEDAQEMIDRKRDSSVTWVNYAVVNTPDTDLAETFHIVRLAQFFFAAQYHLNLQTQRALIEASFEKNVRKANQMLNDAREKMQHLSIQFHVQRSFLRRSRKEAMDMMLHGWDFDDLVENGERMVQASTSKIDQIYSKRSERSSFVTDLILAGIALLTVIEVSLYFTEYSRQLMSNPALEYYDDDMSWVLSSIAGIDTDTVLIGGALSILTLVGLYAYWKLKK
ncbi:MAG: hypothetical protein AAFN91_05885 [Pseudomonadota bacterium]